MKIVKAGKELWHKNSFLISCNFNMNCNFNCSYCFNKEYRAQIKDQLSEKALINLLKDLPLLNKDFYSFAIAGGEPTLYKHLDKFFLYANDFLKNCAVNMVLSTNGKNLNKLDKIIQSNKPNYHLSITLSMHLEQMSVEEYLMIFKQFSFPKMVKIKIMLFPGKLREVDNIISTCRLYGYNNFHIQSLQNGEDGFLNYTKEELDYIKNAEAEKQFWVMDFESGKISFNRNDYISDSRLVDYHGLQCLAGNNSIIVRPNGTVTPCYRIPHIQNFNLNEQSILELPTLNRTVVCPSKNCACPGFIQIPKWDPNYCSPPEYFKGELA